MSSKLAMVIFVLVCGVALLLLSRSMWNSRPQSSTLLGVELHKDDTLYIRFIAGKHGMPDMLLATPEFGDPNQPFNIGTSAAMGWSRFETARAMETATIGTPWKVTESLTQGAGRAGAGRA